MTRVAGGLTQDLFGEDGPPSWVGLSRYAPESGDLYAGAPPALAEKWRMVVDGLAHACDGDFSRVQDLLNRQVQELGLSFRLTGDEEERPWPLNPMPLVIGSAEWRHISEGLIQRAGLLESVITDIYGEQKLVAEGGLPAVLVSGSHHFARKMLGLTPPGGHFLFVYAVDLARGPTGEWRVLADRVRLPTGIGYALENRLAFSRSTGSLLSSINTRRLAEFFGHLRQGMAADCARDEPRLALLTPGRFNQSYPEQAHLARYLGLPLVEGRDLAVNGSRLFVRTIAGLKRVDGLWRWIDTRNIDPLSFDSSSRIGVPDLHRAWASGGLVVSNWPGAGVIEARAFSAFLPRLSQILLDAPLKLPNVATWWCGQEGELRYVRNNFDSLVISPAFGGPVEGLESGRTRAGASFSAAEKKRVLEAMKRRPMDYAAQEVVRLSTTPSLIDGKFEPRPFTLRAFVARDASGNWTVMPGGFARISTEGELRTSLMGKADSSADICVVDEGPTGPQAPTIADRKPAIRRAEGILPSQAADNLFWLGRYCERTEATARVLRTLLAGASEVSVAGSGDADTVRKLAGLLEYWGAVPGREEDEGEDADGAAAATATAKKGEKSEPADTVKCVPEAPDPRAEDLAAIALGDEKQVGSIAALIASTRRIGRTLRDRMAVDFWRIANRPMPFFFAAESDSMSAAADTLIERFSALSGLAAENMGRRAAWRFLDMGCRIERAALGVQAARFLIEEAPSEDDLLALLDLFDSQLVYRSRYLFGPSLAPVLDLVLLDRHNPRALAFQADRMVDHIEALPALRDDGLPEPQLRLVRSLRGELETMSAEAIDSEFLLEIEQRIFALSDAISTRYFLQQEKTDRSARTALLS